MTGLKWRRTKPKFTQDCILVTATWISAKQGYWNYSLFEVRKTDGENEKGEPGWYWGIFCDDGDEWGDIADLHADYYAVVEPRKPYPQKRKTL